MTREQVRKAVAKRAKVPHESVLAVFDALEVKIFYALLAGVPERLSPPNFASTSVRTTNGPFRDELGRRVAAMAVQARDRAETVLRNQRPRATIAHGFRNEQGA
jgi:hypothetical protein